MSLPDESTSLSPQELTDWLERTLCTDGVELVRTGSMCLEFRSKFRLMGPNSNDSLAFLSSGEIEVSPAQDGLAIAVRANPQMWQSMITAAWFATVLGFGNATGVLRWAAGLGGVLIGGVVMFLTWTSIHSLLNYKAGIVRMLRTHPELRPNAGAA